jgi:site-specific DNA recombinase
LTRRAGVQRLLSSAEGKPKPFDVVLVDDSSRIARDIPDAIRVMQQLKFLGIRVIYISQGIDSDSEQADTLVTFHGLVDSMYLKELAKKIKRGLAGQIERGYATGAKTYGYRTVPVPEPSGKLDIDGHPVLLGKRIEVNETQAEVIRRIFEWVAQGTGLSTVVKRLNAEGIPGTRGKPWSKGAVQSIVDNERYLGRQIWGQQSVEHEPGTGRRIMRDNPRDQWHVVDRPDLRIISDELWHRAQTSRAEIRAVVAAKGAALARGKSGKHHSKHLFSGFARCGTCGGSIAAVSGGKGSPRFGCRRSWQEGHACPNRLTIRIKVAEPQILTKLQEELLKAGTVDYITSAVEKELRKASATSPKDVGALRKQLDQEKRKLQNLVSALEGGASAPAPILKAISDREKGVAQLEGQIRSASEPKPTPKFEVTSDWVRQQLGDLAGLLRSDVARVKAEFRRLNLYLTFTPTEAEPRPHYVVKGQCDLSALVFSFLQPAERGRMPGSDHRFGRRRGLSPPQGASLDLMLEQSVHNRTPILLGFFVALPPCHLGPGWKRRLAARGSATALAPKSGRG